MLQRLEAGLGDVLLRFLRLALRTRLRVREHQHRDAKGRVTRWLDCGTARKGTVVWIHGFNDRPDGILRTARALHEDYRVVAPAVPGFFAGWFDPEEIHTIDAYGRWLTPVLHEAVDEPMVMVGNSLGGAISLQLAAAHDLPIRGVVALNPAGMMVEGEHSVLDDFARGQSPFEVSERADVDELFRRLLGRPVQIPFPFQAALFEEMREQADWYGRLGADLAQTERRVEGEGWSSAIDLGAVDVPAMVLWGERDRLFPVSHGERMAAALPQGRLQRLPRIGHIAHIEAPGVLAAEIRRFADELAD